MFFSTRWLWTSWCLSYFTTSYLTSIANLWDDTNGDIEWLASSQVGEHQSTPFTPSCEWQYNKNTIELLRVLKIVCNRCTTRTSYDKVWTKSSPCQKEYYQGHWEEAKVWNTTSWRIKAQNGYVNNHWKGSRFFFVYFDWCITNLL